MSAKRRKLLREFGYLKRVDNKPPKDWDIGYEVVVSFPYGLDEEAIARKAGLRNYDTGITMRGPGTGIRDLMFPCGTSKELAYAAANRLYGADTFGALRIKISNPVEHVGEDSFTVWTGHDGRLLERVKHRKQAVKIIRRRRAA